VANTRHPVLQYIRHHDYLAFYAAEIESRNRFFYPPYSRLILVTCKHVMKDVAAGAAARLAEALAPAYGKYLVGPAEPIVNRVRNQYLMELLIKLPKDGNVVRECKQFILELTAMLHNEKKFRSVVITPDVDPL